MDWQDVIYCIVFQQNYDLNVSGGNECMNFYVFGNFIDQDGIIINIGMKCYLLCMNLNVNIMDKLKMGLCMSVV